MKHRKTHIALQGLLRAGESYLDAAVRIGQELKDLAFESRHGKFVWEEREVPETTVSSYVRSRHIRRVRVLQRARSG